MSVRVRLRACLRCQGGEGSRGNWGSTKNVLRKAKVPGLMKEKTRGAPGKGPGRPPDTLLPCSGARPGWARRVREPSQVSLVWSLAGSRERLRPAPRGRARASMVSLGPGLGRAGNGFRTGGGPGHGRRPAVCRGARRGGWGPSGPTPARRHAGRGLSAPCASLCRGRSPKSAVLPLRAL